MKMKDLLTGALSKVLGYFDLEAGRIYLMDDEGQYLNLAAHQGVQPYRLEKVSINEGFSGKAVRTKSFIAQHVSELEDKNRVALLSGKGFKIIITVPLISMGEVGGVMNLATGRMIKLDQKDVDLLTAIGNQIAIAVNNAKLYKELQEKIQTLKEKKEMTKFFAYSVSHDLKSPAIGVHGFAKRLQKRYGEILDERGRSYCEQIVKTAEQIVSLLEQINAYISAKEAPFNFEKIKPKDITEEIRNEFSDRLKQSKIRWSEPDILPEIIADRLGLTRVFRNFVDNALKYGGDSLLEIRVGYHENEDFHIFSVSDDGVAISGGAKDKIFEIFKRDETSKGTTGAGLGLAIVKEIAERHNGRVWLDTDNRKWKTFNIAISKDLSVANGTT
jgi:K+-sensing histidine kinase KdpD